MQVLGIKSLLVLSLCWLAGCTTVVGSEPPVIVHVPSTSVADLGIPPGHRPPPGSCRVWYPGLPPGQQPPPGSCYAYVPSGAVLVRGD
jgi:hypothetical protein